MPDSANLPFTMRLFGTFDILCAGAPLPHLQRQLARWLLALLTLRHGKPVERSWLAAMLLEQEQQRSSLTVALSELRAALGTEAWRLSGTSQTLCLDLFGAEVDVLAFDGAIIKGDSDSLQWAVALYTAPLLEDCSALWAAEERDRRHEAYLNALETLARRALADGDHRGAVSWLRKAVSVDDLHQSLHRLLMQTLAREGAYTAVAEVYQRLAARLFKLYKLKPEDQTIQVYQDIQQRADRKPAIVRVEEPKEETAQLTIPHPLTALLGRGGELLSLKALVTMERLVTLAGPGGVGKTRLAMEVAREAAPHFVHGAGMVSLEVLNDPALIAQEVAAVLGADRINGRTWEETLVATLRNQLFLLLLDNCEHLLEGCAALLRRLLRQCPGLHVLATSREPLGLSGEFVRVVPPLALPEQETPTDLSQWLDYPAIRLFCERSRAVRADFAPSLRDFEDVARLCRCLDALPLAIELAAPLVQALSVRDLAVRLAEDRFHLLQQGDTSAHRRHQTLKNLLAWSCDLLTPPEQKLLCCLCVFSGGCELAELETVYDMCQGNPRDLLSLLMRLIAKSLVFAIGGEASRRYGMLETNRAYGRAYLADADHWRQICQVHAEVYARLAEAGESGLMGADPATWSRRLEREQGNLRAALTWAITESSQPVTAYRLGGALWRFWYMRAYYDEGRRWMERILQMPGDPPAETRLKVMQGLANLCYAQGDRDTARERFQECLNLALALPDGRAQASALASLANLELVAMHYAEARQLFDRSLPLFEQTGDLRGTALTLSNLAIVAAEGEADFAVARDLHLRGLEAFRRLGTRHSIAQECCNLAFTLLKLNAIEEALPYLEESLALTQSLDSSRILVHCLSNYRLLAVIEGDRKRAAVLMGAEQKLRDDLKWPISAGGRQNYERDRDSVRCGLEPEEWEMCLRQGRDMTGAEVSAFAGERSAEALRRHDGGG
jgi:predicted ATPase/DNA-binding SARP family transcriptional activator